MNILVCRMGLLNIDTYCCIYTRRLRLPPSSFSCSTSSLCKTIFTNRMCIYKCCRFSFTVITLSTFYFFVSFLLFKILTTKIITVFSFCTNSFFFSYHLSAIQTSSHRFLQRVLFPIFGYNLCTFLIFFLCISEL